MLNAAARSRRRRRKLIVRDLRRGGSSAGPIPTLYADLLCTVDGLRRLPRAARRPPARPRLAAHVAPAAARRPRRARSPSADRGATSGGAPFAFGYAIAARVRVGQALATPSAPMYKRVRRHAPRRAPPRPAVPLHVAASRASTARSARARPGARDRGRVRRARGRLVLRRERRTARCRSRCCSRRRSSPAAGSPSYVGCALTSRRGPALPQPRRHRHAHERAASRMPARSARRVKITNISKSAGMIIETFDVECFARRRGRLHDARPSSASSRRWRSRTRSGCRRRDAQRALLDVGRRPVDLTMRADALCDDRAAPRASRCCCMLDRVDVSGTTAAPQGSDSCAATRTSTRTSGSSRRTSSRIRCSPARSASRR